jgi:hypothetical protein
VQRLQPFDVALLAIFIPLWALCFILYVHGIANGRLARVPLFVTAPDSAEDYPTIRDFWPGVGTDRLGLAVGDRLLRVGEAELRGVGPFGFTARIHEQARNLQAPVVFLRDGALDTRMVALNPFVFPWRTLFLTLGFAATAVAVLVRRPGVRVARAFFLAGMTYSFHWTFFAGGSRGQTYAWMIVLSLSALAMFPLLLRFVLLLPEELAPPGARLPRWPWLFTVFGPSLTSRVFGVPWPPAFGLRAELIITVAFLIALLTLLTRNFRRAGPLGRRQLKWVVYGLYIGTAPLLIADAVISLHPAVWWLHESATVFTAFIPLCLLIAIVRFNLFDVDRLISSTATYSILLLMLGAGVAVAVPTLSTALSAFAGIEHHIGQVTLSLFFAVAVLPGQRYLRPQIERLFFAQRYALEQGIRQLERDVATQPTAAAMLTVVGERLFALLQAENCVIYCRGDLQYAPVFVRGSVAPSVFDARSPLLGALQARARAVDVDRWQRTVRTSLSRSEQVVLSGLRVAAVLPIYHTELPVVFLCLGQKRSGDVYTSTDFQLLSAISEKISQALRRFEDATLLQQLTAMRANARSLDP